MDHGYDTLEICKQVNGLGLQDDDNALCNGAMVRIMMAVNTEYNDKDLL